MNKDTEGEMPIEVVDRYGQPMPEWVKIPKESKTLTEEIRKELNKPFPPEAVEVMDYGAKLTTIKAMYIIERLNDVFGVGRWIHHHKIISATTEIIALGRLELLDFDIVVPEQYGGMKGKSADSYKGAVTNSLSKCASYLEIGIDVFKGNIGENEINASKQKKVEEKKVDDGKKMLIKIKSMLNQKQPGMNGQTALKMFRDLTGLNWKSFEGITPVQAKTGLASLLANMTKND